MTKKKLQMISKRRLKTLQKNNLIKAYDKAVKNGHLSEKVAKQFKKEMLSDFNKRPQKKAKK